MNGVSKKNFNVLSGAFGTNLQFGNTTFNEGPDKDQFRMDANAVWTAETLEKGPGYLPFKNFAPGVIYKSINISAPVPTEKSVKEEFGGEQISPDNIRQTITVKAIKRQDTADANLEWVENYTQDIDPNDLALKQQLQLDFRKDFVSTEHFQYVVAGTGITPDSWLNVVWANFGDFNLGDHPSINTDNVYSDFTFSYPTPLDSDQIEVFSSYMKPLGIDFRSEYNYFAKQYEQTINTPTVPETILPNMYAVLTDQNAKQPATKPVISEDSIKDYNKQNPDGPGPQLPPQLPKNTELDGDTDQPKYFSFVSNQTVALTQEQKIKAGNKSSNIGITSKNINYLSDFNDRSIMFPMFNYVELDTQKNKGGNSFNKMLKDAKIEKTFMKSIMSSVINTAPNEEGSQTLLGFEQESFAALNQVVETDTKTGEPVDIQNNLFSLNNQMLDFDEWLTSFMESGEEGITSLQETQATFNSANFASFIGEAESKQLENTDQGQNFIKALLSILIMGRSKKIIKDKARTFDQILSGKQAYSEILMYRIAKHVVNEDGTVQDLPIQNYYISNEENVDKIRLYDTQVKYNKTYKYNVYAYTIVVGTEYRYENLKFAEKPKLYQATFDVVCSPSLKVVEVPYYGFSINEDNMLAMIDDPPPRPDVAFVPLRGKKDRIKILLNGNVDTYEEFPTFIQDTDQEAYEKVASHQRRQKNTDKLQFQADDADAAFQVFRIGPDESGETKKPSSYEDFAQSLLTKLNEGSPSPNASFVDKLEPNKKYYYCFRSIDIHDNISPPTSVFEVTLLSDENSNLGYPIIKVVDFGDKIPKAPTKPFQRYLYLRASPSQTWVPQLEGDDITTAVGVKPPRVGFTEDNLFISDADEGKEGAKKFKIRLTSKRSGKKIDINVRFIHKHME